MHMTARTPKAGTSAAAPPLRLPLLAGADPVLIGITGRAGAGKTTAAEYLRRRYDFECIAFADALKDCLALLLADRGIDHAVLHEPQFKSVPLDAMHDTSARHLMQSLGDWGRQIAKGFWVHQLAHRAGMAGHGAPVHDRICITDVRYPNEEEWLLHQGGALLRITRQAAGRNDSHSSEQWADSLLAHASIPNDSSLGALHTHLDQIMAMLEVPERPTERAPA
jgi:hypothetical protein